MNQKETYHGGAYSLRKDNKTCTQFRKKKEKRKSHFRIVVKGLQIFRKRRYIPLSFFSLSDYSKITKKHNIFIFCSLGKTGIIKEPVLFVQNK